MRFEFSEEQREFQSSVRAFLDRASSPDAVRAAWAADSAIDPDRWRGLADLGVLGMLLPESAGGYGLTELDLVLPLEESGRAALPEPVVDSAMVAGPLLAELGGGAADRWVPALASGDAVAVIQKGGKPYLCEAAVADVVLLVHDDEVHALTPQQLTLVPQASVDGSRKLYAVDWHRTSETLVGSGETGWAAVNRGFDRGALGTAAQLVGLADRMVAMTVAYVSEREQFGVPIGSFQAIKHQLADAFLALEFARPVVTRAAYALAHDEGDRSRYVSMAKVHAGDAAHLAGSVALQCHGAIGYTVEYDLHLYLKRAWALQATWGDPAWHRERVSTSVLGPPGSPGSSSGATQRSGEESRPLGETLG